MPVEDQPVIAEAGRWTHAAVIVLRLALLIFLVWALVSARLVRETPVADDAGSPDRDSSSISSPCSGGTEHLV